MISDLQAFLIELEKECGNVEVDLGGRLSGRKFVVARLSLYEVQEARTRGIIQNEKGDERVDEAEVARQIVIRGCVEPDFKDQEFLKLSGCVTPSQAVDKFLLAGETTRLSREIMKASGFERDINEAVKAAKN